MKVRTLDASGFKAFCRDAKRTARGAAEQGAISRDSARAEALFLSRMDIGGWRVRALFFALEDADGFNAAVVGVRAGKRAVKEWGRYLNVYYLYTVVGYRGRGLCDALLRRVEEIYLAEGVQRMKGSASSQGGLRTFLGLRHPVWGVDADGAMKVDGLLAPWAQAGAPPLMPEGLPPGAAKVCPGGRPPTRAELLAQMTDPRGCFRMSPQQAEAALCQGD